LSVFLEDVLPVLLFDLLTHFSLEHPNMILIKLYLSQTPIELKDEGVALLINLGVHYASDIFLDKLIPMSKSLNSGIFDVEQML
jgi:hypothetical protein